jgi:hypothetical protein
MYLVILTALKGVVTRFTPTIGLLAVQTIRL